MNVVIVDDQTSARTMLRHIIEDIATELQVSDFGDPETALGWCEANQPDLLLLDINMPEVTGLDMVEFLRRREDTRHLPIVMLSSEAADTMVDRAMELGADSYVMKPVTIEELEKAMATAFYKHLNLRESNG